MPTLKIGGAEKLMVSLDLRVKRATKDDQSKTLLEAKTNDESAPEASNDMFLEGTNIGKEDRWD